MASRNMTRRLPFPPLGELQKTWPSSEPARLGLFDVGGREIQNLDIGSLGPGRHVVSLHRVASMNPGLYQLRLVQGGRSLTRQVAVVR